MRVPGSISILLLLGLMSLAPAALANGCVEDATTLCLNNDRFRVELDWRDFAGNEFTVPDIDQSGQGQAFEVNDSTGFFWFTSNDHYEVLVKVLDGCAFNDRFWVFAAATTNVEYSLRVVDTQTDQEKVYTNPFGQKAAVITDTDAYATCDGGTPPPITRPVGVSQEERFETAADPASCMASPTTMCLHANRFSVTVDWEDFAANMGQGMGTNLSDESGHFWFFDPNNIELLVNIIDGRASNGYFWVYFSATTDVKYIVTVTDTTTGFSKQYVNPLGRTSTVLDNGFDMIPPPPPVPLLGPSARITLVLLLLLSAFLVLRLSRTQRS